MSTLGTLTGNGDTLITRNLTVNGPIARYATQSNVDLKESIASMNALQATMENSINSLSTDTYTKTSIDTKLLKQVNYEHGIQNNTRLVGMLNVTNDSTVNTNNIINL